ncbi:hypothetical protein F5I97DRAFT_1935569 [Phlebopus sp. FC_14]|nr:hypothetical protein F5I97DRAFT_1935569 [Phlebopus sp. FC_14]
MTTPFAFVPRKLSKPTKRQRSPTPVQPPATPAPADSESDDDDVQGLSTVPASDKGKGKAPDASQRPSTASLDIATLISLALSDYHIWLDDDLRRKLDESLTAGGLAGDEGAGFVPINYLIRHSPFRGCLTPEPSEVDVVKALRTHANETLEVRMLVTPPSTSIWYGPGKTSRKKDVGAYEVRRKDWTTLLDHPTRHFTQAQWDERTVYMECIPHQYRTVPAITRFAQTLIAPLPSPPSPGIQIQKVTLPPHHLDKPGDIPKCKGYALVMFSTKQLSDALLEKWPWNRRLVSLDASTSDMAAPESKEALKFGFRAIPKARWNQLNEEYIAYRQRLVDEIVEADVSLAGHPGAEDALHPEEGVVPGSPSSPSSHLPAPAPSAPETTPCSPYPFNCLVFVRNVHPETNKTTLRSLFSQAFPSTQGIDYVDFNKGMDVSYLRLATPQHTDTLTTYFTQQSIVQTHGLDGTGTRSADGKHISLEIIQGKKEELYWENVPEKVRRQAVDKAIRARQADMHHVHDRHDHASVPPKGRTQRKRKREQ